MKRLFLILILFGTLLLCSCQREYGILEYQNNDIEAVCLINGEYSVSLKKTDTLCTITVLEPEEVQGISFELGTEGVLAIYGETKIEMDKESLCGISALSEIFSQSEECMTGAAEHEGGSILTFRKEKCTYQITLGKNSMPKKVKILSDTFEYDVEICSIKLT